MYHLIVLFILTASNTVLVPNDGNLTYYYDSKATCDNEMQSLPDVLNSDKKRCKNASSESLKNECIYKHIADVSYILSKCVKE